jgi:hypothetical protein
MGCSLPTNVTAKIQIYIKKEKRKKRNQNEGWLIVVLILNLFLLHAKAPKEDNNILVAFHEFAEKGVLG